MEIWKDIEGYEGLYEVSSYGNIRSCERYVEYFNPKHKRISGHTVSGKLKKLTAKDNGYLQITLYKNNNGKSLYVHRIVAQAFIDNPSNKKTVNHKDFDVTNNNINNLEWATYIEQEEHKKANGRKKYSGKPIIVKYSNGIIVEIEGICKCARVLGIHRDTIYNILNGLRSHKAIELGIESIKYKD